MLFFLVVRVFSDFVKNKAKIATNQAKVFQFLKSQKSNFIGPKDNQFRFDGEISFAFTKMKK